jgi:hypothetical protein
VSLPNTENVSSTQLHQIASLLVIIFLVTGLATVPLASAHAEAAFAAGRDAGGRWWYGSAYDIAAKEQANELALRRCSALGPGCKVLGRVTMGCMAFATAQNGAAGIHNGSSKQAAESGALSKCIQYRGTSCAIQQSFCDSVSEHLVAGEKERLQAEATLRAKNRGSKTDACDLSAHAITIRFQSCHAGGPCRPAKVFLEVLSQKVLDQENAVSGNKGIIYSLGQTTEVSSDVAEVLRSYQAIGVDGATQRLENRHTYATASFDGAELILMETEKSFAKGHPLFADGTFIGTSRHVRRIVITRCATCNLSEHSVAFHHTHGSPTAYELPVTDQTCQMEPMK